MNLKNVECLLIMHESSTTHSHMYKYIHIYAKGYWQKKVGERKNDLREKKEFNSQLSKRLDKVRELQEE